MNINKHFWLCAKANQIFDFQQCMQVNQMKVMFVRREVIQHAYWLDKLSDELQSKIMFCPDGRLTTTMIKEEARYYYYYIQ